MNARSLRRALSWCSFFMMWIAQIFVTETCHDFLKLVQIWSVVQENENPHSSACQNWLRQQCEMRCSFLLIHHILMELSCNYWPIHQHRKAVHAHVLQSSEAHGLSRSGASLLGKVIEVQLLPSSCMVLEVRKGTTFSCWMPSLAKAKWWLL